jgi:hypothetical protein
VSQLVKLLDSGLRKQSSSIILQKTRQFFYTPYITACCEHLASWNEYPTDKYLPYMITVQTLIEGVEDLVNNTVSTNNGLQFFSGCQEISQKCTEIKETLPFPLSESRKLAFINSHLHF